MDITATSGILSQGQTLTNVGVAMLSKNLDMIETLGDGMVKMMEQSVNPNLGQNVDIKL
jgi:hypothetical protein